MIRYLFCTVMLCLLTADAWATHSGGSIQLGVFAYRPVDIMVQRYQPLTDYLSKKTGLDVRLHIYDQAEMERAITHNRVDFFLTNPSHFLVVRNEKSLSGVLATLIRQQGEESTMSLGGVILVRKEQEGINTLADIGKRTVLAPGPHYLGGYQTQALELLDAGVDLSRRGKVVYVGGHDSVVEGLLARDGEVGFVRTGILEELSRDRPGLAGQFRVVNRQNLRGYPFVASTRLYPEWPLVSLPHVELDVVRSVASALFSLNSDHPAARAAGLAGFAPPADYQSVENLARRLRLPPYDKVPEFTWGEAVYQYRYWVAVIALLMTALAVAVAWLGQQHRKLRKQETQLVSMAHYDALTGLPNRTLLTDRLRQAMAGIDRQGGRLALAFIDLDQFKPVNDRFGHEAGDQLLVEISRRMRGELREQDTLARLGGDEFVALMINVQGDRGLDGLLHRLLSAVSAPVVLQSGEVRVSASIGVALYPQQGSLDGDQLIRQADQAMYRAKQSGKNRYALFR
ncbi:PhnD/SsuA/transferrin family substrate-binding protein [Marinobacter sp.]|uniref:PhnD/SsuA/transferrin family substrate-binding protein n=1 Tax=Marinobacter sp. TaxID=50741 RepID=UPI0019C01A27|nr:PhnD/SsuA/transferrin family substrate-binding protein [Marinobacter sp.]MBC7191192.1 PhnD/SsuA/transferrin family substrate-binding protein [Marinobacter sp.]